MRGNEQLLEPLSQDPPPLVSIVTACLNSADFLEKAIESVLQQDYPRIDYIVMDGGSTDGTLGILERYGDLLRWHSGPDAGTAEAINRGFQRCSGSIFAFLHADDVYTPGAVSAAVRAFQQDPDAAVVYGEADWIDSEGQPLGRYPTQPYDFDIFRRDCFICQPAAFIRSRVFKEVGMLDATLGRSFDYDLWIRIGRRHSMRHIERVQAFSRMHRSSKTLGEREGVFKESMGLLLRHFGYVPSSWVYGYCCLKLDRRDQFFEPLRYSFWRYLVSLTAGLWFNRRHPLRFLREWLSASNVGNIARWLKKEAPPSARPGGTTSG